MNYDDSYNITLEVMRSYIKEEQDRYITTSNMDFVKARSDALADIELALKKLEKKV